VAQPPASDSNTNKTMRIKTVFILELFSRVLFGAYRLGACALTFEFTGLRGISRRSSGMMGWASASH
jgi:hypothetical protein